jgi:hypothetical protein
MCSFDFTLFIGEIVLDSVLLAAIAFRSRIALRQGTFLPAS